MLSAQERVFVVSAVLAVAAGLAVSSGVADAGTRPSPVRREVEQRQGVRYEMHGPASGRPLVVLLAASDSESDFGRMLPAFAKARRVIFVDVERTITAAELGRPMNSAEVADALADLLRELAAPDADIMGYGAGGGVATQLALRYPALAHRVILLGSLEHDGIEAIAAPVLVLAGRADRTGAKHLVTMATEFLDAEIRPAS